MKTTLIKTFALAAVAMLAAACVKDNGNYDYKTRDEIFGVKIAKFDNYLSPISVRLNGNLSLDVKEYISGTGNKEYIYEWYCRPSTGLGSTHLFGEQDNPNLNVQINTLGIGLYSFFLDVRDPDSELFVRSEPIHVEVGGGYGPGWYVFKSMGEGHANVDLVEDADFVNPQTPESESGKPMRNVRSNVIASELLPEGEPFRFGYLPWYSADLPVLDAGGNPTGKVAIQDFGNGNSGQLGAFMLATRNNIWTLSALTMAPIRSKFEDHFFFAPANNNIDDMLFFDATTLGTPAGMMEYVVHLFIEGQEHIYTALTGPGRFSQPKMGYQSKPYSLAPFMARIYYGANMAFDRLNHRFIFVDASAFKYEAWKNNVAGYGVTTKQPEGMPNLNDMPYDLVWMGESTRLPFCTYTTALMKSTTSNEHILLLPTASIMANMMTHALTMLKGDAYPFERMAVVEPGSKVLDPAAVRFVLRDRTDVYFGLGNTIYWYRTPDVVTGSREEELFKLPEGEVIKDIRNIQNNVNGDPMKGSWCALVLSNDAAGNWHLRAFRTTGTDGVALSKSDIDAIASKPEFHYTGSGTAADVAYRGSQYLIINK